MRGGGHEIVCDSTVPPCPPAEKQATNTERALGAAEWEGLFSLPHE